MWCKVYVENYIPKIETLLWHITGRSTHNESTDEIDVSANFWALFKDKSPTPRYSTLREKQYRPRRKIIFKLQKYYEEGELRE